VMFPGATADRAAASYVVVGAPLDATTTFQPGTRFGPDRVRRFAETFDDYDHHTDTQFSQLAVHDAGDVAAWDDTADYLDHLTAELRAAVIDDAVPVTVGGEHTISWAGVRATAPSTVVILDAHLDLRDDYDGNPLSHACVTRRMLDGLDGDHPTVDRVVILGARTGSPAEWERADAPDVTVIPPGEVADWEPSLSGSVYLSVDIDGADPAYAPGTAPRDAPGRPRGCTTLCRRRRRRGERPRRRTGGRAGRETTPGVRLRTRRGLTMLASPR